MPPPTIHAVFLLTRPDTIAYMTLRTRDYPRPRTRTQSRQTVSTSRDGIALPDYADRIALSWFCPELPCKVSSKQRMVRGRSLLIPSVFAQFFNTSEGCRAETCSFLHVRVVPFGAPLAVRPRPWRSERGPGDRSEDTSRPLTRCDLPISARPCRVSSRRVVAFDTEAERSWPICLFPSTIKREHASQAINATLLTTWRRDPSKPKRFVLSGVARRVASWERIANLHTSKVSRSTCIDPFHPYIFWFTALWTIRWYNAPFWGKCASSGYTQLKTDLTWGRCNCGRKVDISCSWESSDLPSVTVGCLFNSGQQVRVDICTPICLCHLRHCTFLIVFSNVQCAK